MNERPNGFIPNIRPRNDLGVDRDRAPADLGSYTTAGTDVRIECRRDGYIEFGGLSYTGWSFAYGETPTKFRALSPGDMFPSPSSGLVILRSSASATGQVDVSDWSYAEGFVKALSGRPSVVALTAVGKYAVPTASVTRAQVTANNANPDIGQSYTPTAGTVFTDYISPDLPSGTANTDTVYIGTTDEDLDTTGVPIPPGGSIRMYGTATVYMYSPTAGQKIAPVDHTA